MLNVNSLFGSEVDADLLELKQRCDVIIADRLSSDIKEVLSKVYNHDLFGND